MVWFIWAFLIDIWIKIKYSIVRNTCISSAWLHCKFSFRLLFFSLLLFIVALSKKWVVKEKTTIQTQLRVRSLHSPTLLQFGFSVWLRWEVQTRDWELPGPTAQRGCAAETVNQHSLSGKGQQHDYMISVCLTGKRNAYILVMCVHKCVLQNTTTMPMKPTPRYSKEVFLQRDLLWAFHILFCDQEDDRGWIQRQADCLTITDLCGISFATWPHYHHHSLSNQAEE